MTPSVQVVGLSRRYGRTPALEGVDLEVESGRIVAITGPNGAGKTTLLRVLATILRADDGDAWINGAHVLFDADAVRAQVGVALVNDRGMYWRLSGTKNLLFFARALGMSKKRAAEEAARVAAEMAMEPFADRPVMGYSAGQRQRLVLARASLGHPSVLLIDEPMRGLDDDGIARARAMLQRHAREGATVLIAAPTVSEFEDLCDARIVLRAGQVVAA